MHNGLSRKAEGLEKEASVSSEFLSRKQVAALLGKHTETIKRYERAGKFPAFKVNSRTTLYSRDDINSWLNGTRYQRAA